MQSIIILLLFVGMFIMVHGVFDEKYRMLKQNTRVEYRFVPRTFYEEQLSNANVTGKMKNMFENASPWMERKVGGPDGVNADMVMGGDGSDEDD